MKKKLFLAALAIAMTVSCAVGLAACDLFGEESSYHHQMQHVDAVAATCTEDGSTEYWACSDCGKYFSDAEGKNEIADLNSTVISAKGHNWGEWKTEKEATCIEDGYKERECSVCHKTEKETLAATGHTFSEDWSSDETYHWHACPDCGAVRNNAEHSWDDGVVTKQPACTQDGIMTYTCTICEETKTAVIPASGHDWGEWKTEKEATCAEDGYKERECSVCHETEQETLAATGHTFSEDWSSDETYHWHACPDCGAVRNKAEHTWENGICSVCKATETSIGLTYTLNDDKESYSVTGIGTCTDTEIIIPAQYNGLPVTSVGENAFFGCTSLTGIAVPGSVKTIGRLAFGYCISLTCVTIEDGVTGIAGFAFYRCYSLTDIILPDSVTRIEEYAFSGCVSLTGIAIPGGVASIPNSAFRDCSGLKEIALPDNVTSVGDYAFSDCASLTGVTIGNGVTSIGSYAFEDCGSLTSVTIGSGVTKIGNNAFYRCDKLTEICNLSSLDIVKGEFSNGYVAYYAKNVYTPNEGQSNLRTTEDGYILYEDGETVFLMGYTGTETALVLPDSIDGKNYQIYDYAFQGQNMLASVTIGSGVTKIGTSAFSDCVSLTSVTIGGGVTSIEDSAFEGCYKLVEVYDLSSLDITKGEISNGHAAYYALNVYTTKDAQSKLQTTEDGYLFYEDGETVFLMGYTGTQKKIALPDTYNGKTYQIYNYAFAYNGSINDLTIPDGVTNIGEYAFLNCCSLLNVIIRGGAAKIGNGAFSYCSSLMNITLPDGIETIGTAVFANCSFLVNITIPDSVTSIGSYAFYNCSLLASVTLGKNMTSIEEAAFINCYLLTSVTFENTSGWRVSSSSTATSGTSISESDLTDPFTAATYLKSSYVFRYWKRG